MKFHVILITVLMCNLTLKECTESLNFNNEGPLFKQPINNANKKRKDPQLNLSAALKQRMQKGELYSSFMELSSREKAASTMLSMNRLENTLRLQMASQLMENRKKRYTEGGKECAPTFSHEGKTYDDCTMVKTPDMQDAQREWCYIKDDQLEDNKRIWDFCRPDLNYDKIRKQNQERMFELNQQYKNIGEGLSKTVNDLVSLDNQAKAVDNNFQEIDMNVGGLMTSCRENTNRMDNLIQDHKETQNLENLGVSLGAVLNMKEGSIGLSVGFSSFLELELMDAADNNVVTGPGTSGMGASSTFTPEGALYGNMQSDASEVIQKDIEEGHMTVAPWLQYRALATSKNGAGMDQYEQDNPGDGIIGKYFNNMRFLGSYETNKDPVIDFDFTGASPAPGFDPNEFSIRWQGYVLAPHTGEYQFILDTNCGMSMSLNDQLILSKNMFLPGQEVSNMGKKLLESRVKESMSTSNSPKSIRSLKVNLIGGNKYKIIVTYFHTASAMIKEEDPVYVKLFWKSNIFSTRRVEKKYLFSENVFDPLKITGITPDIGVVRKLLNNDLAFKDKETYVITDVPPEYEGYNCLKLNMRYEQKSLKFELNNPSIVYIAFPEYFNDPTPIDFDETNKIVNINHIPKPPKNQWKSTEFKAQTTIPYKIKKKQFDAGRINISLNKVGTNNKSIPMLVFFGYDRFNDSPTTCGGEEFWISQPTSPYYNNCKASSEDVRNARRCEEGLNGEMRDEPHGGSIWGSINEGVGAWMQINFKTTFQVSKIEFQDRSKQIERTKMIEVMFSNGVTKNLYKQNTSERREYRIDPPVKSHYVKFTIKQVYSTGNNGGAFKIYGYKCKKSIPDDDSPENVGTPFITGTPHNQLPALFDLEKNRPINLDCNDTLDSSKFSPHQISVGSKLLIYCRDSCITSSPLQRIYGEKNRYSKDSIICKAALHSQLMPITGGKLYMEVGFESRNMRGGISAGLRAWPKKFSKYTISFKKFIEQDEIILKEGSLVDLKNPNREGWIPGKIIKVVDRNSVIQVICAVENASPSDPVVEVQYPSKDKMAACGDFIPNRDCEGSRKSINKNRPLRWKFVTQDSQTTPDIKDFGGIFGSTGKAFGWSRDMTSRVKKRNMTNDPRLTTLVEFPPSKKSLVCNTPGAASSCEEAIWSVKTGPGIFNVKVGVGDPLANTRLDLKINSNYLVKGAILAKGEFQIYEGSTQAINDFITIRSECIDKCEFQMSKMNMIEISPVIDDAGWQRMLSNQKKPERYDPCGNSYMGGRCEDSNPENCLYEQPTDKGVFMCFGALSLVKVPSNYKCPQQIGKLKCCKKIWFNLPKCNANCPNPCNKVGKLAFCQ